MSRHAAAGQPPAEREPWYDPSIVLGSSGPARVSREDDADPGYAPPRLLGFGLPSMFHAAMRAAVDADARAARDAAIERAQREPLLWDGDQA